MGDMIKTVFFEHKLWKQHISIATRDVKIVQHMDKSSPKENVLNILKLFESHIVFHSFLVTACHHSKLIHQVLELLDGL